MRRGTSLTSRLARIALAYALALQALLGAFAGVAAAPGSGGLDPALSLCRTIINGEQHPGKDRDGPLTHCAVMCLSGACAAGDPPTSASAAIEFPSLRVASLVWVAIDHQGATPALRFGPNARGPPTIG
jgi:hypothetical protein